MRILLLQINCFFIALCAAFSVQASDVPQTISLVGDPWPPYVLGKLGQEASGGVGLDLMQTIFERLNLKTGSNFKLSTPMVPWERALREVERGSKDGIGILLKTPGREAYMAYTDALFQSHDFIWYTRKNFPNGFSWNTYEDLEDYSIGIVRGHSYGSKFDQLVLEGTLEVVEVSSAEQLFAMLDRGRFDLAIEDNLVGASFTKKFQSSKDTITYSEKPLHIEIYYIAFSRKSAAQKLIPAINTIISDMTSEGEIERIIQSLPK